MNNAVARSLLRDVAEAPYYSARNSQRASLLRVAAELLENGFALPPEIIEQLMIRGISIKKEVPGC
jgi:hypothetical protein